MSSWFEKNGCDDVLTECRHGLRRTVVMMYSCRLSSWFEKNDCDDVLTECRHGLRRTVVMMY